MDYVDFAFLHILRDTRSHGTESFLFQGYRNVLSFQAGATCTCRTQANVDLDYWNVLRAGPGPIIGEGGV